MNEKILIISIYLMIAISVSLLMPFFRKENLFDNLKFINPIIVKKFSYGILIISTLFLLILLRDIKLQYIGFILIFTALNQFFKKEYSVINYISILFAFLVLSFLPWWTRTDDGILKINSNQSFKFILLTFLVYFLYKYSKNTIFKNNELLLKIIYLIFSFFVVYIVLFLGTELAINDGNVWHHWGAYVGPAQLVLAGVIPLNDIPVQYGLGPTLLLSQGCKINCWMSMYWFTNIATILFTFVIAWIALLFINTENITLIILTLLTSIIVALLWTSNPSSLTSSISTPSTSGMRFLPGLIMLAWCLKKVKQKDPLIKNAKWGHLIWLLCILWSPEAGLHATAVWVPYFVWTCNTKFTLIGIFKPSLLLFSILIAGLSFFTFIYRLAFNDWPSPIEYIIYLIYPPGAMPVNPTGSLIFAIVTLILWLLAINFSTDKNISNETKKSSWLVSLLFIANFTYYLGRSHDNNILNLMPYLFLVLIATRKISIENGIVQSISTILLSGLIGLMVLFGVGGYKFSVNKLSSSKIYNSELINSFNFKDKKLEETIIILQNTHNEQVEYLSYPYFIASNERNQPWSAIHSAANYFYIPSIIREKYIGRVAKRLKKTGWILYEKDDINAEKFLKDYNKSYYQVSKFNINGYVAIRMKPL
jgi:hypothetical protein